ncbi:MAG: SpvB/TcaC N-terminal domain-containing protein [Bryobacteraceae bacterium]
MTLGSGEVPIIAGNENQNRKSIVPDVDPSSGALVYNYPIAVPPGRNNLQPSLAIGYNSQNLDHSSIVGYGWSINIPYIERVNKRGVDQLYSRSDFTSSLDGELVSASTTGQYLAKTENGNFNLYQFADNQWLVTDKQGTQYKFGYSTSTRQDNQSDSSQVYKWMLQEVRDTNDNYVNYEYFKDNGQIYPADITYTGHGEDDGIFDVAFTHEATSSNATSTKAGFSVKTDYLIAEIDAKINGTLAHKYELSYGSGNNGSSNVLTSITETGVDEQNNQVTLPATTFTYQNTTRDSGNPTKNFSWAWIDLPPFEFTEGVEVVDVNGDGLDDVVQAIDDASNKPYTGEYKATYLGTIDGWASSTDYIMPVDIATITPLLEYQDEGVRFADFNGDGLVDFLNSNVGGAPEVYLNNGSGWTLSSTTAPVSFHQGTHDFGARIADLNGDGLPDLIDQYGTAYLNNGNGWDWGYAWGLPTGFNMADGGMIVDFNGDGLPDLLKSYRSCNYQGVYKAYSNDGHGGWIEDSNYTPPVEFIYENCYSNVADESYRIVDANGDGLPDIYGPTYSYINNGHGWTHTNEVYPLRFKGISSSVATRLTDFTGDGIADVMYKETSMDAGQDYNNYLRSDVLSNITTSQGGSEDITYNGSPQYKESGAFLNPQLPINLLTVKTITSDDGLGNQQSYTYTYKDGTYYFSTSVDRKFAGFGQISVTDAQGNVTKTYYHTGTGSDSSHGEYQDNGTKIGRPYRVEQYDNAGHLYKTTINKWDSTELGNDAAFVKLAQTVESAYDGDVTHKDKAESYTYDNTDGNLTQKVEWGEVTGSDDGTFSDTGSDKLTTDISYAASSTPHVLGLKSDETKTDQNSNKVSETRYYYDSLALGEVDKGNPTKQEQWVTGSTYVNSQKAFNSFGLATQATDPRGKVTSFEYDPYNLYVATSTNPLLQSTLYQYDYSSGKVKQTTDPNGLVFQTVYDGLDRVVAEKQPDLASPSTLVFKTEYVYTDDVTPSIVHQTGYQDGSTSVDTYTYLDGLGRMLQTRREDVGTFTVKDFAYNNRGLLDKESLPYFSSGSARTSPTADPSLLISYTYDPLQRVATTTSVLGSSTNQYSDWEVTTRDLKGVPKDLYRDAYGNLVQVIEHNIAPQPATRYYYNGLDNLIQITDANNNVRHFTYDGLGRRLTAEDLHASWDATFGSWSYTFDDAGNLISRLDPKSQTVNYTYDDINRPLTEDFTGQAGTEVSYAYDSCTYGIGRLCTATSTGAVVSFQYNPLGKTSQESNTIDSTPYLTAYAYDRQGNILTIANPDSSQVKYIYNSAGQLDRVQRKESTDVQYLDVATFSNYSPQGQIGTIDYANAAQTTNTYGDAYRLATKYSTSPVPGGGSRVVQNLAYTYDPNSNITGITNSPSADALTGISMHYTYDNLNRLVSATSSSAVFGRNYSQRYDYDYIGNLLYKSDQGYYTYAGNEGSSYANSHAATSYGHAATTVTYDNNGNVTSMTPTVAWYSSGGTWTNRKLIIIDHTKVFADNLELTDFPMLFKKTDPDLRSTSNGGFVGKADGSDILFTYNDGTKIDHEITSYDPATGSLTAWIKMTLPAWADMPVFMYFGNPSSGNQQNPSGVWSNGYVGAWHMNEDPTATAPQIHDSTGNGNNASAVGYWYSTDQGSGPIDKGLQYNVLTNAIEAPASTSLNNLNAMTLSGWIQNPSMLKTTGSGMLFSKANSASAFAWDFRIPYTSSGTCFDFRVAYDRRALDKAVCDGPSHQLQPDSPAFVSVTWDGGSATSSVQFYINGEPAYNTNPVYSSYDGRGTRVNPTTYPLDMGNNHTPSPGLGFALGTIYDEARVSNTPRGAGWIATEYANQSSPEDFYTYGDLPASRSFAWDYENRLTQAVVGSATSTYAYDYTGQRVKQAINGTTTVYPSMYYNVKSGTPTKHIFANGVLVATVTGTGVSAEVRYVFTDQITGANIVTAADGTYEEMLDYYPYGSARIDSKTGAYNEQRRFAGQEFDPGPDLTYMNARYYDSVLAKFLSEDPTFLAIGNSYQIRVLTQKRQTDILQDPQALNSYGYARSNPLRYSDPDGKWFGEALNWFESATGAGEWLNNNSAFNYLVEHPYQGAAIIGIGSGALVAGVSLLFGAGYTGLGIGAASTAATVEELCGSGKCDAWTSVAEQEAPAVSNGINITSEGMLHIQKFHTLASEIPAQTGRSYFFDPGEIPSLIEQAQQINPELQSHGGSYMRIVDAGRPIGWDRATEAATNYYTVITSRGGDLINSFPGLPSQLTK